MQLYKRRLGAIAPGRSEPTADVEPSVRPAPDPAAEVAERAYNVRLSDEDAAELQTVAKTLAEAADEEYRDGYCAGLRLAPSLGPGDFENLWVGIVLGLIWHGSAVPN